MLDRSFIEAIQNAVATDVVTIDDKEYATAEVFNPPLPNEPRVATLEIATLTGLVDYCKSSIDDDVSIAKNVLFLHVESFQKVSLVSVVRGERRERDCYIEASCEDAGFPFNHFMPHAQFMIGLQAQFLDYGDRAHVLKVLGTIRDESIRTSIDDGVTQRVTASAGTVLNQEISVPNPVMLRPYRTFAEIEQPPSEFILRVRAAQKGTLPEVALFEADGGRWKHEAVGLIKEYLSAALPDWMILA